MLIFVFLTCLYRIYSIYLLYVLLKMCFMTETWMKSQGDHGKISPSQSFPLAHSARLYWNTECLGLCGIRDTGNVRPDL